MNGARRVVITGFGAVSTWGWDADALWRGLLSGETGIGEPHDFVTEGHRTRLVGEVPEAPRDLAAGFSGWRRLSRADRFAVVAAREACVRAGLDLSRDRFDPALGVFFGGSTAGMPEGEDYLRAVQAERDSDRAPVWLLTSHQLNGPGDAVARCFGACGPVRSYSSACASGGLALGAALDSLRAGEIDVAFAGGSDALCQLTYSGFNSLRAVDERPSRPFRRDREGLSLGEGAGVLVLETAEHAAARGAEVLAELLGAGASCDAHHMTAPHPRGEGAADALRRALKDAGLDAGKITFVNAHGTGTPHNDAAESHALAAVFGGAMERLPVTSTKGSVGHLLGSSGAIEAVATVQCLIARGVHPTPGSEEGADEDFGLDLVVRRLRPFTRSERAVAVSTSFGFGGANAAVVLGDPPARRAEDEAAA